MLGVASPQSVLAETAEVLKGVNTIHFRVHAAIPKGAPVRECWTRGDKTYVQVHYKGDLIRVWLEPDRYVVYEKKHNRVTITQPPPGLVALMRQINDIREFDPKEWEPCEPSQVIREGGACRLFQAPGTGSFTGSANGVKVSGESRVRILIDEKTHLPSSLEGLLKPKGSESWPPHLRIEFIWDGPRATEDLFEPHYPDTVEVRDQRPKALGHPAPTPAEPPGVPIATASWQGEVGVTLEKLWLHPGGLLVLRAKLHGRMPSARPPELRSPEANPWGPEPSEIAAAVAGQMLLDGVPAKKLGRGAVKGRWALYLVYRFEPSSDFSTPETLLYRHLLVRTRSRADKSRKAYLNSLLTDPSSWGLYDTTVAIQEHVSEQIPDEILRSPNLRMRPPLKSVVVDILRAYERARGKDAALAFYQAQAPSVQAMLKREVDRLRAQGKE